MVEDTKPLHKFCTGYSPLARSHMCFQKPLMMWLFETHVASQYLPLPKLEATYDGELSEPYRESIWNTYIGAIRSGSKTDQHAPTHFYNPYSTY